MREVGSVWLTKLLFAWVSGAAVGVRERSVGKQQHVVMITIVNDDSAASTVCGTQGGCESM